ncbi:hypothetical protein BDB00DRAFT_173164 [Zychaea mexicana]|uniref:uncharacterized protein n=1 Tax=Zychaea mexicana TaxID=64656 RepID=UPI0022FE2FB6|nr:uncharacterized protein BDB00DRAFT_173164 [Zychaea mexicana]KAI9479628.1 hypothetical protein BDB00DRAFT_173164 [Zychaea mexicana]
MLAFLDETDLLTLHGTDEKSPRKDTKSLQFTDLSMNFEYGAMPTQGLLLVEIKPPIKVRSGSRHDLIKLANEMKDSLDQTVGDGMDDPSIAVLALLIEGFRSTLFVMDLQYQGVYRLIPLSVFYIPRDGNDLVVLSSCYEALGTMQVKDF